MKIIVKTGGYGYKTDSAIRLAVRGETVDVPEEEALRLIAAGDAAPAEDLPPTRAEAGAPASPAVEACDNMLVEDEPTQAQQADESGSISASMKAAALRDLMKQNGLPYKVGMTKAEMAAALNAHFGSAADDSELPPDPDADPDEEVVEDGELPPDLDVEVPSL